jgi:hypothetical protein
MQVQHLLMAWGFGNAGDELQDGLQFLYSSVRGERHPSPQSDSHAAKRD